MEVPIWTFPGHSNFGMFLSKFSADSLPGSHSPNYSPHSLFRDSLFRDPLFRDPLFLRDSLPRDDQVFSPKPASNWRDKRKGGGISSAYIFLNCLWAAGKRLSRNCGRIAYFVFFTCCALRNTSVRKLFPITKTEYLLNM